MAGAISILLAGMVVDKKLTLAQADKVLDYLGYKEIPLTMESTIEEITQAIRKAKRSKTHERLR